MQYSLKFATNDFVEGIKAWRFWLLLAWMDIRLRYRRSQLGPFWLTLSMAITIYTMGFLYGNLFNMDLQTYYPYLAAGMLTWNLLSQLVNESADAFNNAAHFMKQDKFPPVIFIFRMLGRNFIIFFHNIVVMLPILIFFHMPWHFYALFHLILSLAIIFINGMGYGLIIAMLCTRYRDFMPIVNSLTQVIFFITPVLWHPGLLPAKYHWAISLNPFSYFVNLLRAPLMGNSLGMHELIITLSFGLMGLSLALLVLAKVRNKIIFWL